VPFRQRQVAAAGTSSSQPVYYALPDTRAPEEARRDRATDRRELTHRFLTERMQPPERPQRLLAFDPDEFT
jgi:hypothetical protein